MSDVSKRRAFLFAAFSGVLFTCACEARKGTVMADVVLFSYLNRPIYNVKLGHLHIGGSNIYPYTGGGAMAGLEVPLGRQHVALKLDGPRGTVDNGTVVRARNAPVLEKPSTAAGFLAVHIYPDNEVELFLSQYYPVATERGKIIGESILANENHGYVKW